MAPEGITVNSASDLVASVPDDIFSGADEGTVETEPVETTEGEVIDSPEEAVEEAAADEPEQQEEPAEEEPAAEQATAEELPDGVRRGKDSKGKDGLFVEPKRWENIYNDHKAVREYSEMLGEPLTRDALDLRNRAFIGQEKLYSDLLSADPASQAAVLNHFLEEGARAVQEGAVGADPIIPLTDTFYETIQAKHPDAYASLRTRAARDLVQELYNEAQSSKSADVFRSAGWVAKTLGLPYKSDGEMQGWFSSSPKENPLSAAQQRISELEQQLNGRQANTQAAQLQEWQAKTTQTVTTAVLEKAVKPALTEYQTGLWAKQPEAFQRLVTDPLHRAVREAITKDRAFNDKIALLDQAAKRASAQRRTAITVEIEQAYVNRARLAADALRPQFLKDAAATLKGQSDANHQRLKSAENQRGPKGSASPVPRPIVPNDLLKPGETFDTDREVRRAMQLIG